MKPLMSKSLKALVIVILAITLGLGSLAASGGLFDAYKMTFGQSDWQTPYNRALDAINSQFTTLFTQFTRWVGYQDYQTATHITSSQFTVAGDLTLKYAPSRLILEDLGADGIRMNTVASSSYATGFTIVNVNTPNLTTNLVRTQVSAPASTAAWIFGADYGSPGRQALADALSAIGSNNRALVGSPGAWAISSALTFPANVEFEPAFGFDLQVATGVTVTFNGPVKAGAYKWISCTGTGKVVFGPGAVREAYPEWFGAVADSVTDSSTAINQMADACRTTGTPVCFPGTYGGYYLVTKSLNFTNGAWGWHIYGKGSDITRISATLSEAYAVLDTQGTPKAYIHDLRIQGEVGGLQTCALSVGRPAGTSYSDGQRVERVCTAGGGNTWAVCGLFSSGDLTEFRNNELWGPIGLMIAPTTALTGGSKFVSMSPSTASLTKMSVYGGSIVSASNAQANALCCINVKSGTLNCFDVFFSMRYTCTSAVQIDHMEGIGTSVNLYSCRSENTSTVPSYILYDTVPTQGSSLGSISGLYYISNYAGSAILKGRFCRYNIDVNFGETPYVVSGDITLSVIKGAGHSLINHRLFPGSYGNIITGGYPADWPPNPWSGYQVNVFTDVNGAAWNIGGIAVGGGTMITRILSQTATWADPGAVLANTAITKTVSVPGVRPGDPVLIGCSAFGSGTAPERFISAAVTAGSTVGAKVFTGTGLNDALFGGSYYGAASSSMKVIIDTTGTVDTFQWQKDSGDLSAAIPITGNRQNLGTEGVWVIFTAVTGHTAGDFWTSADAPGTVTVNIYNHSGVWSPGAFWITIDVISHI
ncbi:MAG: hypothetical protein NTY36_00865 [Deltaproteobacteria bacterium]|nr:hypothetical protein [Deltaproteobacteria bacterium]